MAPRRRVIRKPSDAILKSFQNPYCRVDFLQRQMKWDLPAFRRFQKLVRQESVKLFGSSRIVSESTHPTQWTAFVDICVAKFPALGSDFEDAWPIEVYYKKYTTGRTKRAHERERKVGHLLVSVKTDAMAMEIRQKEKIVVQVPDLPVPPENTAYDRPTQVISAINHDTQVPSPIYCNEVTHFPACTLCGYRPFPSPTLTIMLTRFFEGNENLRQGFETAGILTDNHFRSFLELSANQQLEFMLNLPLAAFDIMELMVMLQQKTHINRRKEQTRQIQDFSHGTIPPMTVFSFLCTLECDHKTLLEMIGILAEEYFDFVHFVEEIIPVYLNLGLHFKKQEQSHIERLVRCIRRMRPACFIFRYEKLWPLQAIARRYLAARSAGLPGTLCDISDDKVIHRCRTQCRYLAANVPQVLKSTLTYWGMEELGPAFLSIGLNTNESWERVTKSHDVKTHVLESESFKLLKLTDFQRMIMRHILGEA